MNKKSLLTVIILVVIAAVAGVSFAVYKIQSFSPERGVKESPAINSKPEINALSIYHWWTSPSEAAAINKLIGVFTQKYPDVAVISSPVVGGAGYAMFSLIKPMVLAGEAPDAFQMHAAYEAMPYFNSGLLDPIDNVWQSEGLEKVVPKTIQDMCKFEDHYYAIPVNVHRVNVVWYNKQLLDKNGIDPTTLTSWDAFFAACDKLKAAGVAYPIQMGSTWTISHAFEQVLASGGIAFYEDLINGKVTSAEDPRLLEALGIFKKYLSYANPDQASLGDWDKAIKRIVEGKGAFNIMGDWVNGEFKLIGMTYGKEYGTFPVPGTSDMYGLCVDTFQHPKGVSHPTNAYRWLRVVASQEGQDAFNTLKGSIPARSDTEITNYDDYQKSAIADFRKAKYMYPSMVHGSGVPDTFKLKLMEIINTFAVDLDVAKAAQAITNQTRQSISEYTKHWLLK